MDAEHELDLAEIYLQIYGESSKRVWKHIETAIHLLDLPDYQSQQGSGSVLEFIHFLRYMAR